MSGEPESVITARMPYARALQYQNQWYLSGQVMRQCGIVSIKPKKTKGLKTIL